IVHCHDWHAALIPVFLKFVYKKDPFYKKMKSVMTIHNLAYQGVFSGWDFARLDLDENLFNIDGLEFYGEMNLLKGGIVFCDRLTTVSPGYAKEVQKEELGYGLAGAIRKKGITGILNGLDYDFWNPQKDPLIAERYFPGELQNKSANKKNLQSRLQLPVREDIPLFGFVGRLSEQKGLDLIAECNEEMMKQDLQVVFLGTGDEKYYRMLRSLARRYRGKAAIHLEHDEPMAHQIYAGSDIFLMPSVYEPCGLSQMISLRYGTIPLVYKTGGLADTISHFNASNGRGNGFVFDEYNAGSFVDAIEIAVKTFQDKKAFHKLVKKAFTCNFSWEESSKEYKKLYQQCLQSA
ncbi:MAG: glycogen synthase, partial [Candidatus Paceibacterales bacterium]